MTSFEYGYIAQEGSGAPFKVAVRGHETERPRNNFLVSNDDVLMALNECGRDGWELAATHAVGTAVTFWVKRPLPG